MADLKSLGSLQGVDNPGGLAVNIYVGIVEDFLSIKGLKTTNLNFTDKVEIDGEHTFKAAPAGLGWYKIYGTLESGKINMKKVGDRDGKNNSVEFEFFHPGNSKDAAMVERRLKNNQCIVIVEHTDGVYEQIGSERLPCEIMAEFDGGEVGGGRRGWMFKGQAFQMSKQFYPAAATFTLATI